MCKVLIGNPVTIFKGKKWLKNFIRFRYLYFHSGFDLSQKKRPLLKMHFCMRSGHLSSKVLRNCDLGKWLKKVCVEVKSSRSEKNYCPLKAFFKVGNNQKSHRAPKFKANMLPGFQIYFFATRTTFYLACIISLPVCKKHTIHRTMFILALQNLESIPLSENIVVVRASFTGVPHTSSEDTDS